MIAPPERSPERDAAIDALLPNVAFDGWTLRSLRRAAGPDADLLFPGGAADMIEAYCDLADRRMEEGAAALPLEGKGLTVRVRAIIALRLEQNRLARDAVRRAAALLALPRHARLAGICTARTVDAIWHAAGDRSTDFSWYTKRAILASIYCATLFYWLRDTSEDDADTLAFLDRRLAGLGRFGKLRARFRLGRKAA
jgi:ubiquinone biosynthesis protein COQ9